MYDYDGWGNFLIISCDVWEFDLMEVIFMIVCCYDDKDNLKCEVGFDGSVIDYMYMLIG